MSEHARLRVAVVGPTNPNKGGVAAHTTTLAHELDEAGHEVALVSWSHLSPSLLHPGERSVPGGSPDVEPFPATTRPLSWSRPDTWWRTGRSLREADVILVVHVIPAVIPAHLALLRAARGGPSKPTVIGLVPDGLPHEARPGHEALLRRFLGAVDVTLVHSAEQAEAAHRLGAADVSIAALPAGLPGDGPLADRDLVDELSQGIRPPDLDGLWARYVAAIERIGAVRGPREPSRTGGGLADRACATATSWAAGARSVATLVRAEVDLHGRDLPEWVRPTDVLTTPAEAADVVDLARSLGLPRTGPRSGAAAWAALGALSAVLRVRDGDRRTSVIVDSSGPTSVFSRWARAIGYATVALDTGDQELHPGSLDVIARLHPHGCTAIDVDAALAQAARVLRRGGVVTLTVPVAVHQPGNRAVGATLPRWSKPGNRAVRASRSRTAAAATVLLPADLRAVVARADPLGLSLVGDVDRDITPLLSRRPAPNGTDQRTVRGAYALVRLTFRRTGV